MRLILAWGATRSQPTTPTQPPVSVIVAARNEAAHLPRLLDMLTRQEYPCYEVIIVDDRSTDATPDILAQWQRCDARVRSVRIETASDARSPKIAALKQGIAQATGEILLFTDADCLVLPTWIARMAARFTPNVGAVLGYAELDTPNSTPIEHVQAFDYFAMMSLAAGATKLGHPLGAAGANIAYCRRAYDQVGGFDALPSDAVADDMALVQKINDLPIWQVAFCDDPGATIHSAAVPTLKQAVNQRLRWMTGGQDVLQHNWALLVVSITMGLFNGMLLSFPVFLVRRSWRRILGLALLLRLGSDLLAYTLSAQRFERLDILRYYPLWLPVQIVWTNLLPLLVRVQDWTWKE